MALWMQGALIFLAALGLSLILCALVIYRVRMARIENRVVKASIQGVSTEREVAGESLATRFEQFAVRVLAVLVTNQIWPRKMSASRILAQGIYGSIGLFFILTYMIKLTWWISALAAISGLVLIPVSIAAGDQKRTAAQFESMLADTIDMMIRMLRAGLPVTVAVERVGREASEPAGAIYREAAEWLGMGMPLAQAMRTVAERIKMRDFDFFAAALAIQSTVGGNLTQTLESLSEVIRERTVSILKARAVTAQARTTANVILGIIPFLAVMLQITRPDYLAPLIDGSHGYNLIIFVVFSYTVAFVVIRRLIGRVNVV